MDDFESVRGCEAFERFLAEHRADNGRERLAVMGAGMFHLELVEITPPNEFRNNICALVDVGPVVVNLHDVGMVDAGGDGGFLIEARGEVGVFCEVRMQDLNGHLTLQREINRAVDSGHSAIAHLGGYLISAVEDLTNHAAAIAPPCVRGRGLPHCSCARARQGTRVPWEVIGVEKRSLQVRVEEPSREAKCGKSCRGITLRNCPHCCRVYP